MFKASLSSAGNLIKIVDALATIIDIATFEATESGIEMREIDTSHIVMVHLNLQDSAFDSYECDQPTSFCINLNDFNRFLKRGSANDALNLTLDSKKNKFKIQIKREKSTRTFSLNLITESEEKAPTPTIELDDAKFSLSAAELQRAIKDGQIVGDHITFTITNEVLTLEATGEGGDVTIEVEDFTDGPEINGPQSSMYSLEFLADIIKAASLSETVKVEFSSEMPIRLNFPIEESGNMTYLLAPFVQEEDDDMDDIVTDEGSEFEEAFDEG